MKIFIWLFGAFLANFLVFTPIGVGVGVVSQAEDAWVASLGFIALGIASGILGACAAVMYRHTRVQRQNV